MQRGVKGGQQKQKRAADHPSSSAEVDPAAVDAEDGARGEAARLVGGEEEDGLRDLLGARAGAAELCERVGRGHAPLHEGRVGLLAQAARLLEVRHGHARIHAIHANLFGFRGVGCVLFDQID